MTKILMITNDSALEKQVNLTLKYHGFVVHSADGTSGAWKLLTEIHFDLIMIDSQLKHESGLAFYKALRMHGSKTPMLMVGEGLLDEFVLKDLSTDNYDYLMKPFFFQDLKMKINGLIKSSETEVVSLVQYGSIRIDIKKQLVLVRDEVVRVGKTELKILMLLARKAGEVVDLKRINELLDKNDQACNLTALFYVRKLRSKIEKLSREAFKIIPITNGGFKLEFIA